MAPLFRAGANTGLFLIGITRGGYAGSTRRPAHGYYLCNNLANAELILIKNQGHLAIAYENAAEMIAKALSYFSN
jgi:hypothetical protein